MTPWQQFLTNLSNLLKVKTIITLAVVIVFCYMTITGAEVGEEFMYGLVAVITYYFARRKDDDNGACNKRT